MKYVVFITEVDEFGKTKVVKTEGCRFTTDGKGTVTVYNEHNRAVAAWPQGQWNRASTQLNTPPDPMAEESEGGDGRPRPGDKDPTEVVKSG